MERKGGKHRFKQHHISDVKTTPKKALQKKNVWPNLRKRSAKHFAKPMVQWKESIREVPQITVREQIQEVPQPRAVEVLKEVPKPTGQDAPNMFCFLWVFYCLGTFFFVIF